MALDEDTGYYTLRDILGYNCKVNVVLSDRGRGKTYGTKHFLMSQPGRFMCLYLDSEDMERSTESWIDCLLESGAYQIEQLEWEGSATGKVLKLNGVVKGYFRYLTAVRHIKHEKFPEVDPNEVVNWIWVDEFITPDTKKLRGIKSIGDAIRMIMKTVDHDSAHPRETRGLKPLRLLMYANPFTWDNELLAYFHILPKGFGIHRAGPDIVYEFLEPLPDDGKMTMDKFLGDEVNKNMGFLNQMAFIDKFPKNIHPYLSVRFGDRYYHIYKAKNTIYNNYLWIKQGNKHKRCIGINGEETAFGTLDGLREDEVCIDKTQLYKHLLSMLYQGKLRFPDINVKFSFMNDLQNYK